MVAFSKGSFSENLRKFSTDEIYKVFQIECTLNFPYINVIFRIGMYDIVLKREPPHIYPSPINIVTITMQACVVIMTLFLIEVGAIETS